MDIKTDSFNNSTKGKEIVLEKEASSKGLKNSECLVRKQVFEQMTFASVFGH